MDVNVCFSAHRDGSIHLQDDYWGSRHLSELGETKIYCAIQKKKKKHAEPFTWRKKRADLI